MKRYGQYRTVLITEGLSLEEKLSIVKSEIGILIREVPHYKEFKRWPEPLSNKRVIPELDEMKFSVYDQGNTLTVRVDYYGEVEEDDEDEEHESSVRFIRRKPLNELQMESEKDDAGRV